MELRTVILVLFLGTFLETSRTGSRKVSVTYKDHKGKKKGIYM